MSLSHRTISNLFGGVSQQPAGIRLDNQCEELINAYPSISDGLVKRPPSEFIGLTGPSGAAVPPSGAGGSSGAIDPPAQFDSVYATVTSGGEDIYRRDAAGDFIATNQVLKQWWGVASAPNKDIYATRNTYGIYKRDAAGDFNLYQSFYFAGGIGAAPNGDMYAVDTQNGGYIWKQPSGDSAFVQISGTSGIWWSDIVGAPNGNIYVAAGPGGTAGGAGIYMQTAGAGAFNRLSGASADYWEGICAAPNGDIYACLSTSGGTGPAGIYKQTGGVGDFIRVAGAGLNWFGIASSSYGDIFASVFGGDVYWQRAGTTGFVALGQAHRAWRSLACVQP